LPFIGDGNFHSLIARSPDIATDIPPQQVTFILK
jgi:hypothetical protein